MIKTMLKLLVKLTANFLIRCLVKKYMSRIVWPHMNILLTYQNKHVHIIIYIFSQHQDQRLKDYNAGTGCLVY